MTKYDFSEKTIAPFCTHGGGGFGRIPHAIAEHFPEALLLKPFKVYGSGGKEIEAEVAAWLDEIKSN